MYHNHRRGEARRKSRRIRSRIRRRLRASGGATGGAQFSATTGSSSIGGNSVLSQPGFYNDYRQVRILNHKFVYFIPLLYFFYLHHLMQYSKNNVIIFRLTRMCSLDTKVYR